MIIFPAIDLKDGKCVRLLRGEMNDATVFNNSPADQAMQFARQGAEWIHVVDLNGAFAGEPINLSSVNEILDSVDVPVQLGGGIRSLQTIETWLDAGIARVILGTVALTNPQLVKDACKKFPNKIVVGLDGRGGFVATEGWANQSELSIIEIAKLYEDAGVAAIIYTDVSKDGAMQGPDFSGTEALCKAVNIPIIASGGVSSMADLVALKKLESNGLVGAIVGRAIYDGAVELRKAVNQLKAA